MTPHTDTKVDEIVKIISQVDESDFASELDRRLLLSEAQKLVWRLQTPLELTTTLCHTNTFINATMRALLELDFFKKWEADGGRPATSQHLAQLTGCPVSLLERFLRVLTTAGMLSTNTKNGNQEVSYVFTDFAKGTASGRLWNYWYYQAAVLSHAPESLPAYLKQTNFREPTNSADSPFAMAKGTPIMDWAQANPQAFTHLSEVMSFKDQDSIPWISIFPVEQLVNGTQGPVLVDVGGSIGHDLKIFHQKFSSRLGPGQLVLQDQPHCIEQAGELPSTITKQAYDFFTEQPVKNARAYYLHTVLHDWPVDECLKILAGVKEAMKPGYSRILIHEMILSLDSTPFESATDVAMMVLNAGAERTEKQWQDLLTQAGLRIVKIHKPVGADQGIIEAEI